MRSLIALVQSSALAALCLLTTGYALGVDAQQRSNWVPGQVAFQDGKVTRAKGLTFNDERLVTHEFWLYAVRTSQGIPDNKSAQQIPIEKIKAIVVVPDKDAVRTVVTLKDGTSREGWNWPTDRVNVHEKDLTKPTSIHRFNTIAKITFD